MITLKCGRKLKVKSSSFFFRKEVYLTKLGWVCEKEVYSSRFEMEEAILSLVRNENERKYTWAYLRPGCMPGRKAREERALWGGGRMVQDRIYWWGDGGLAVAVKLDSLGCPVDYLSLDEWSNIYNWSLPPGDWHMFQS
jgi:hypothetical protein